METRLDKLIATVWSLFFHSRFAIKVVNIYRLSPRNKVTVATQSFQFNRSRTMNKNIKGFGPAHVAVAVLIVVATLTKSQDINCNQPPPMVVS